MVETFGERLAKLRKEQGLTQAMLGQRLGKGDSTVRMWELNKNQPNHEYLRRLAEIFNVSTDYLLGQERIRLVENNQQKYSRPALRELLELAGSASDEELKALLRMARAFLQK